jgi:Zn-dependent M28 family amino/carboxypeptidase
MKNKLIVILGLTSLFFSCTEEKEVEPIIDTTPKVEVVEIKTPQFNQDSAYNFIQKQVNFGPRVPNSKAHVACGNYLTTQLKSYGANVIEQTGEVTAFNNAKLNIKNIIGQFSPEKEQRIMLFAHWDTRPFADRDNKNLGKPIDGANDGGSGVGVLLEIARLINKNEPNMGVDIIFFDAEDYGATHSNMKQNTMLDDWCLGTQYWAKNPPIANYRPRYGILLDMVGAENAVFPKEYLSMYFAENVVNKVWNKAQSMGYGQYFVNTKIPAPGLTDDHRYVNTLAHIPSIDIVHFDPKTRDFGTFHHTHKDNMDLINKNTLKAVGQTVLEVIYNEKP